MGDRIEQGDGGKGSGTSTADSESGVGKFLSNMWGKAREGASDLKDVGADLLEKGQKAGGELVDTVQEELQDVDTDELAEKGKQAAKTGIDVYQGDKSTGNEVVDGIIDFGKELNPFKGLTDKAVDLGEKGLDGKEITTDDLKEAGGAAARNFVPIPGSETLQKVDRLRQLDRKYGVSDRVVEAVNSNGGEEGARQETVEADSSGGLPDVDIVDGAKKLGNRFKGFLRSFSGDNKEK